MSFCIRGMRSCGTSTAKSPRAIIIPSAALIMSSISFKASGFSIFAITFIKLFFLPSIFFRSITSCGERTNDKAIQFAPLAMANFKSFLSFSVSAGTVVFVSGRLTPLLLLILPPITTRARTMSFLLLSITRNSILPSSINMASPGSTSLGRLV